MLPRNSLALARISDARDVDDEGERVVTEKGVTGQIEDDLALAARLGWQVGPQATHHLIENHTSAFKRRKTVLPDGRAELRTVRPDFRRGLAMLADGRADGLIAYDLDRTVRDPRDLEDLIDVIEASNPRIPVVSVTGSLALANDADIAMARVMVTLANKSSRDTSRRVKRERLRQARSGQFGGGGRRRYGFDRDGVTIRPDEAAEIRRAADAILAGVSLRQVTAGLRDRGVPTVTGAPWHASTLKDILLRPRNAGLMVYRPSGTGRYGPPYSDAEIVGSGSWQPIMSEAEWRALTAILTDPGRTTPSPGGTPRWLGSRIYICGACKHRPTVVMTTSGDPCHKYRRYICGDKYNIARAAVPVDEFVTEILLARLERPDAAAILPVTAFPGADLAALRREETALRELLDEQARLHARRQIDGRQLAAGTAAIRADLDQIEAAIAAAASDAPAAALAGRADAREIWDSMDTGRRRAVLRALLTVTILPGRRGPGFDPESVKVEWQRR